MNREEPLGKGAPATPPNGLRLISPMPKKRGDLEKKNWQPYCRQIQELADDEELLEVGPGQERVIRSAMHGCHQEPHPAFPSSTPPTN